MEITILIDRDLQGHIKYLKAGLQETGWDQLIQVEFKRLGDYGLPDNYPDQEIWRFAQQQGLLLITNNRNSEDETSLQATMQRESTADSLPVVTVSDKDELTRADYRQQVAQSLIRIIIDLDEYRGARRVWAP